jgi:hypothetical protein
MVLHNRRVVNSFLKSSDYVAGSGKAMDFRFFTQKNIKNY